MYYGENAPVNESTTDMVADADETAPHVEVPAELMAGKNIYDQFCKACHMNDGTGVQGMNPPLAGTDWVLGDKERLIGVILNGLNEPVEIKGDIYQNAMAPHNFLDDQQIADVLTFVRQSFGNKASAVETMEVAAMRKQNQEQ
jgi:mono/diheme cytochrome c family protein